MHPMLSAAGSRALKNDTRGNTEDRENEAYVNTGLERDIVTEAAIHKGQVQPPAVVVGA